MSPNSPREGHASHSRQPKLAASIDRELRITEPEPPPPLVKPRLSLVAAIGPLLTIKDIAAILKCSRRLVERMRSAGKLPQPDLHVGRMPRWQVESIQSWIDQGGGA
jgi:hypothetical protein